METQFAIAPNTSKVPVCSTKMGQALFEYLTEHLEIIASNRQDSAEDN